MFGMLAEEGFGMLGTAVAFMAGAVTFGLLYSAMDNLGQSAVDNVIN